MKSSNGVWPWPPAPPAVSLLSVTASGGIFATILTTEGITFFTSGDSGGRAIGVASGGFSAALSALAGTISHKGAAASSRARCRDEKPLKRSDIGHQGVKREGCIFGQARAGRNAGPFTVPRT